MTDSDATVSVVLCSGGVESSALLRREARDSASAALFVDYGQKAAAAERRAVRAQCRALSRKPVEMDLAQAGEVLRGRGAWRPHIPFPHRNLALLALGLNYAARIGARRLCLALNRADTQAYPGAAAPFLEAFDVLARILEPTVAVVTPFRDLDKAAVARIGAALGIDFATTYSCLLGHRRHCGACPQCRARRAALLEAGIRESAAFYRRTAP